MSSLNCCATVCVSVFRSLDRLDYRAGAVEITSHAESQGCLSDSVA